MGSAVPGSPIQCRIPIARQNPSDKLNGDFDPGTGTSEAMQLSGMLTLTSSLVSAAQGDHTERAAALEHAADLAEHTGEGNALWFGFGVALAGVALAWILLL